MASGSARSSKAAARRSLAFPGSPIASLPRAPCLHHRPAGRRDPAADQMRPIAHDRARLDARRVSRSLCRPLPGRRAVPTSTSGRFLPGHARGKRAGGTESEAERPGPAATLESGLKSALRMPEPEPPWDRGLAPGGPAVEPQTSPVQPHSRQLKAFAVPSASPKRSGDSCSRAQRLAPPPDRRPGRAETAPTGRPRRAERIPTERSPPPRRELQGPRSTHERKAPSSFGMQDRDKRGRHMRLPPNIARWAGTLQPRG